MTLRHLIACVAKMLYKHEYSLLRTKLCSEYDRMQMSEFKVHNGLLEKLLISGEDHRFRYHFGFDLYAIVRAVKNRILHDRIEGASTIEQQLVRVLTNDFQRTLKRKVKEILLATTLSDLVPRQSVPTIYLRVAYFGAGMNGIEQAFKKLQIDNASEISSDKCAEIIARIKYPEPQQICQSRITQIEIRKNHLLALHQKHLSYKYLKIYD